MIDVDETPSTPAPAPSTPAPLPITPAPVELDEVERAAEAQAAAYAARQLRRPLATWALAITITLVFGLQLALGGAELVPVLARLGALIPERVLAGEVWRLVSSSFLHAGFVHFALNTWVLLVIGSQVEKLLGTARYVVLYTAATLGAGVAAVAMSEAPLTVGASGGIFGLLAAEAMFVFTPRAALLPPDVLARRRRAAMINIALNVAISFRPNVSLSAHLGGAVVGALLVLVGLAPSTLAEDDPQRAAPSWLRGLAWLSGAVLAAGLVTGIAASGAASLAMGMELARVSLPGLGISAEVPVGLAPLPLTDGVAEVGFGNALVDPAVVAVARVPLSTPIAPEDLELETVGLETSLAAPPEGGALLGIDRRTIRDRPAVLVRYHFDGGLTQETIVVIESTFVDRVDVVFWDAFAADYRGLAERMVRTIE